MGLFWVIDYVILIPLYGCEIYACSHHLETIFISAISPLSFKMNMSVLLKEEHWSVCSMGDAEMTSQPPSGLGRTNWHWHPLGLGPCYPGLRFQHEVLHGRTKKVKNGPPAHQATMFLTEHEWCSRQINRRREATWHLQETMNHGPLLTPNNTSSPALTFPPPGEKLCRYPSLDNIHPELAVSLHPP